MSAALTPPKMTAEEFLKWSPDGPSDTRYELVDGEPMAMAPQTFAHARTKYLVARQLENAITATRLRCEMLIDGMGVQVASDELFIPDVMVRCGAALAPDARLVSDPMIVVEVISQSTQRVDEAYKLTGYFTLPSLRHYLVIHPTRRSIAHHHRQDDGTIVVRFAGDEPIRLDPPGIVLEGVFPRVA